MKLKQSVDFASDQLPNSFWQLGTKPITAPLTATLLEVIAHAGDARPASQSGDFVAQAEQFVDLVTESDVVCLMANGVPLDTPVVQCMTDAISGLSADQSLSFFDILDVLCHLWPW